MSKKTQKLQTKLYKALTKYLLHIDNQKLYISIPTNHLHGYLGPLSR